MKIAACVILYHPKKKDLSNILTYLPLVDKLYVCDNTENSKTNIFIEDHSKVLYIFDSEKKGYCSV